MSKYSQRSIIETVKFANTSLNLIYYCFHLIFVVVAFFRLFCKCDWTLKQQTVNTSFSGQQKPQKWGSYSVSHDFLQKFIKMYISMIIDIVFIRLVKVQRTVSNNNKTTRIETKKKINKNWCDVVCVCAFVFCFYIFLHFERSFVGQNRAHSFGHIITTQFYMTCGQKNARILCVFLYMCEYVQVIM